MTIYDPEQPDEEQGRTIPSGEIVISHAEHMAAHAVLKFLPSYEMKSEEEMSPQEWQNMMIDFHAKSVLLQALICVRLDLLLKHYEKLS